MKVEHHTLSVKHLEFSVNNENYKCTPSRVNKPCFPQDEFDTVESCKICKQYF